jgi:hypothetical protein
MVQKSLASLQKRAPVPEPPRLTLIKPPKALKPAQAKPKAPRPNWIEPVPVNREITEVSADRPPRPRRKVVTAPKRRRLTKYEKDEQALREMARRHLSYEVKMLRELADALQGNGVGPRTMRNALLESFLIHYRNLYDFFYPDFPSRRRLPGDICAGDYLHDSKRWRKRRPETDAKLRENRERVNSLLAHLTLRRLKYKNRSWQDRKMAAVIEELLQEFLRELPRERRAWFRAVIAKKPVVVADLRR